jgi:ketosteroid isomerase-like protein
MKKACLMLFFAAGFALCIHGGELKAEKEIWALEEIYISSFVSADHTTILSMYHERFLGWPDEESKPAGKGEAARYLKERFPEPSPLTFQIDRQGMTILGKIVINHYLLTLILEDGDGNKKEQTSRMTHTWIKTDKGWQILGGMSNRQ